MIKIFNTALFPSDILEAARVTHVYDKIKTIYDVGCMDGDDSRRLTILFPEAKVYAFDALKSNYDTYLKDDPQIKGINLAVSDTDGEAIFHEKETNGIHSLFDRGAEYGTKSYTVPVRRLDTYIEEHHLPLPDLIKLDVEGGSYQVLRGLGKYLPLMTLIHLETEDYPYFAGETLHKETVALLEPYFKCVAIAENRVDEHGNQFDSIWVRNET